MKHLICFSGGHSSALVALEVANKFSTKDLILLNHDINEKVENSDIKRFKNQVANYLNLKITYANHKEFDKKDQFDICLDAKAFSVKSGKGESPICSNRLKTEPFHKYLKENPDNYIIYYGFDASEKNRIERRKKILDCKNLFYEIKTDFPLALWYQKDIEIYNYSDNQLNLFSDNEMILPKFKGNRIFKSTKQIGIEPPLIYSEFKHANCTGCLKAGQQHWYVVYCLYPEIFEKAKYTENKIGNSILKKGFLKDLEYNFRIMKESNIPANEYIDKYVFWSMVKKVIKNYEIKDEDYKMCGIECIG